MDRLKKSGHSRSSGADNKDNGILVPKWKREGQSHRPTWWITTYCWSHGAGSHPGAEWNHKRLGHKSEEKATTRLGGSTFGLPQDLWRLGSPTSTLNLTNNELNLEYLANFSKTKTTWSGKPPTNLDQYGIANTGATQNYIRLNTPCINNQKISNALGVIITDSSIMQATHRALLNLNLLLTQAYCIYHVSSQIQSGDLISIMQLCDDGCISNFTATHLSVVKDGLTVLEGKMSSTSGM